MDAGSVRIVSLEKREKQFAATTNSKNNRLQDRRRMV